MKRARFAACFECRGKAQSIFGVTDAQRAGLALGSQKGTNYRRGYRHKEESKRKICAANLAYWATNPEKAKAHGVKNRGERAYNWKGGVTQLNKSVRQMHEYRKWAKEVRERDNRCVRCGSIVHLEAHHKRDFSSLLSDCGIKNRDDARRHGVIVFDVGIGETLCRSCHYAEHGRKSRANRRSDIQKNAGAPTSLLST